MKKKGELFNSKCENMLLNSSILTKIFIVGLILFFSVEQNFAYSYNKDDLYNQTKEYLIKGKVEDIHGNGIIGATVVESSTGQGTITDFEGNFELKSIYKEITVNVSYIGYLKVTTKISAEKFDVIVLHEDVEKMEEVVVIGYGTQKKGEVASAIGTIKSKDFLKVPSSDAAQMIKGQIAGLSVISTDGDPMSKSQIALRGITTLKASSAPLVLIDGIPGELDTVSPDDIEQIDVLKDGSAAAIYGTRGTNGVILITTKNPSAGKVQVDVNAYLSFQKITKELSFFSPDQYRKLVEQNKPGAIDGGANTDWMKEVTRTPLTQVYNISLKGGTNTTNYIASFEYRDMNGLMKRSDNKYMYPRIEVNHRMFNDKLKINASVGGYKQEHFAGTINGNYNNDVYRNALTYNPTTPLKDENGNWSESPSKTYYMNPVSLLYEVDGKNENTNLRLASSLTYTPIEDLSLKLVLSSDTKDYINGYYETQKNISTVKSSMNGYASRMTTKNVEEMCEFTVQYNKNIKNDHRFSLLGGYSFMKHNYQNFYMINYNFPSDDYTYNKIGIGQALAEGKATEYSYQSQNQLKGYFGRFNYNYKGKYVLSATIRHEGSSKFGVNNKWGTFPAISFAWNIKDENFVKNLDCISTMKFRVGYGITGTEPTDPYMSLNTLSFGNYVYFNGEWIQSIRSGSNANPDLKWEKKKETNIGIDLGFIDERIKFSFDYYRRKTEDLLWNYTVPSPPFLYSSMVANAGTMENKGLELALTAIPIERENFSWTSSINYSANKNKLLSLSNDKFISNGYSDQGATGEPITQSTHRIQEGEPIGNFYGYKSIDIDDDGHWIIEGADGNPKPISEQQPTDKKILGNGLPKHYLNWNNTFTYKNFDLSIYMRGAFGFDILNMSRMQYEAPVMLSRGNIFSTSYDLKYGKKPLADDQELQYVSYYIEKGDYWKIDNITLGYSFKFNNDNIKRLRVYGTINNFAVFTGYSGIDPEVSIAGLVPGIDDKCRYPATRTFTFGLSLTF